MDFKAIPYKDVEVLEWRDRIGWAHGFYQHLGEGSLGRLADELRQRGITHVVVRAGQDVRCQELTKIYEGGGYALYRVKEARKTCSPILSATADRRCSFSAPIAITP